MNDTNRSQFSLLSPRYKYLSMKYLILINKIGLLEVLEVDQLHKEEVHRNRMLYCFNIKY